MNFSTVKTSLLCLSLSVLLIACDSPSGDNNGTANRSLTGLVKITAYADDNTNPKHTLEDYQGAAITGVTASNLVSVNKKVDALEGVDVDTASELQAVVTSVNDETPHTKHPVNLDTTKPVITLLGDASVELAKGSIYTDEGVTAIDNKDGKMLKSIADERWGGTAAGLGAAIEKYTSNYPHVVAGVKGNGVDVVAEIHDWADNKGITIDTMKHMNAAYCSSANMMDQPLISVDGTTVWADL